MDPRDFKRVGVASERAITRVLGITPAPMDTSSRISVCRATNTRQANFQQKERFAVIETNKLSTGKAGTIDGDLSQITAIDPDGYIHLKGKRGRFNPSRFKVKDD